MTQLDVGTSDASRFELPSYSYAEADRIAGVTRGTAKRWTRGYVAVHQGRRTEHPPVTPRAEPAEGPGVSFFDLIEIAAIGRLKDIGWSLPEVRKIVEDARDLLSIDRPLVTKRFRTDGREAFVSDHGVLVRVGVSAKKGQQAWDEVLGPFLQTIEYEGQLARRWWPLGTDRKVVVDPDFGFDYPVIAGSGVRTETVLEQIEAHADPHDVVYDFGITSDDVSYALAFEASRSH